MYSNMLSILYTFQLKSYQRLRQNTPFKTKQTQLQFRWISNESERAKYV